MENAPSAKIKQTGTSTLKPTNANVLTTSMSTMAIPAPSVMTSFQAARNVKDQSQREQALLLTSGLIQVLALQLESISPVLNVELTYTKYKGAPHAAIVARLLVAAVDVTLTPALVMNANLVTTPTIL